MDAQCFDALIASLSRAGTRRGLLRFLAAPSFLGAAMLVDGEETAAKRKRHNRRAHNHRHSGRRKAKRKDKRRSREDELQRECERKLKGIGCFADGPPDGRYAVCPEGTDMRGLNLQGCILERAILRGVLLPIGGPYFGGLAKANLQQADLTDAHGMSSTFYDADLRGATLNKAKMMNANFGSASLDNALVIGADLSHCDFQGAVTTGATMQDADLRHVAWLHAVCPNGEKLEGWFSATNCCGKLNGSTTPFC